MGSWRAGSEPSKLLGRFQSRVMWQNDGVWVGLLFGSRLCPPRLSSVPVSSRRLGLWVKCRVEVSAAGRGGAKTHNARCFRAGDAKAEQTHVRFT